MLFVRFLELCTLDQHTGIQRSMISYKMHVSIVHDNPGGNSITGEELQREQNSRNIILKDIYIY